ncbi:MAG: CNNM domain-containing protein, partial [Alphaproteobacteria bacterium]
MDEMDWGTLTAIGIIFGLLLVSAFFSGAETALTAASRARLHRLEQDGNRRAGIVNRLRERKERLIGTILLGNNLVNILASALATSLLIGYFGEAGIAYATLGMTLLVLIFAEVMPKTYAINKADQTALRLAPLLRPLVVLLGPITETIQVVVRFALRLFGVKIDAELVMGSTEEELRGTIDLHEGPDPEVKHERRMLRSILDLADVDVGEIMIHRSDLAMIDADAKPSKIVEFVLSSRYTRIPAWRGQP